MKNSWAFPFLFIAASPLSAAAQPAAPPPATERSETRAQELAEKYKVPLSEVQGLRDQKLGWGEINNALAIARKSGQPVSAIVKLHDSGMGWGKIAQKYGFKLGDVVGRGHDRDHDRKRDHDTDRDHDKDRDRDRAHEGDRGDHGMSGERGRGR